MLIGKKQISNVKKRYSFRKTARCMSVKLRRKKIYSLLLKQPMAFLTGLAGKNDEEQLRADMIVDCCEDITNPVIAFMFHEPDSAIQVPNWSMFICSRIGI
jgi:hypothetical protein